MRDRLKISDNYYLDEFIDHRTYLLSSDVNYVRSLIDSKIVDICQYIRRRVGVPVYVNTWFNVYRNEIVRASGEELVRLCSIIDRDNSVRKFSGFRPKWCEVGSPRSAHKLGLAADIVSNHISARDLFSFVLNNISELYKLGLRRIEDINVTGTWVHLDTHALNVKDGFVNVVDLKTIVRRIRAV